MHLLTASHGPDCRISDQKESVSGYIEGGLYHPRLLRCTLHFRVGSKPEITAAQHWHPLQPDQQTLRVRTLYAQHVELAFNVAEYEIGARHHRGPPSPSVAFSAP